MSGRMRRRKGVTCPMPPSQPAYEKALSSPLGESERHPCRKGLRMPWFLSVLVDDGTDLRWGPRFRQGITRSQGFLNKTPFFSKPRLRRERICDTALTDPSDPPGTEPQKKIVNAAHSAGECSLST